MPKEAKIMGPSTCFDLVALFFKVPHRIYIGDTSHHCAYIWPGIERCYTISKQSADWKVRYGSSKFLKLSIIAPHLYGRNDVTQNGRRDLTKSRGTSSGIILSGCVYCVYLRSYRLIYWHLMVTVTPIQRRYSRVWTSISYIFSWFSKMVPCAPLTNQVLASDNSSWITHSLELTENPKCKSLTVHVKCKSWQQISFLASVYL